MLSLQHSHGKKRQSSRPASVRRGSGRAVADRTVDDGMMFAPTAEKIVIRTVIAGVLDESFALDVVSEAPRDRRLGDRATTRQRSTLADRGRPSQPRPGHS